MPADLVVEASGHGSLTEALLNSMGWPLPEITSIGVDIGYATAFVDIPKMPHLIGWVCSRYLIILATNAPP